MPGRRAKRVIKVFPVESCQRIAEEFVDTDPFAFSFLICILAKMPAMKVEGLAAVTEFGDAYGIQPARPGLPE